MPIPAPHPARARRRAVAAVAAVALCLAAACHHAPSPAASGGPADVELRVLVLNMHAGTDAGGRDNLDRVAALVRETGADVVLLQEVDSAVARSGRVDQPAALARRTGFHARFGNALPYQGGGYGVAILSRWPVTDAHLVRLPVDPPQVRSGIEHEPRGVLHVTIAAPGGPLHVLNTHLDASAGDHWRRQEADSVLALALRVREGGAPVLVGGDFNSTPDSEVQARLRAGGLRDLWPTCGEGDGLTYPVAEPVKRIDYLFAAGATVTCARARVLDSDASDHRGVLFAMHVAR